MNLLKEAIKAVEDKKGLNISVFDIRELITYTDYIFICSGTSDKHVQALADNIIVELKKAGGSLYGIEGMRDGAWVLIDFGNIVFHVFKEEVREYYKLETLWKNGKVVDIASLGEKAEG